MNKRAKKEGKSLRIAPMVLFAFCALLYTPALKGAAALLEVATLAVAITYVILNYKTAMNFVKKQEKLFILVALLICMSIVSPLLHGTEDFSYVAITTYFFRKAFIYAALLCLVINKHGQDKAVEHFLHYFAATHVAFVVGTILLVLVPQFQNVWFSIFQKSVDADRLLSAYGYTFRIGWQGFAGFRLTLYCTLSVIFTLYLRYGNEKQLNTLQFLLLLVGNIVGNMFYGRSGLIITIIISAIAIIYWNRKRIKNIVLIILAICSFAFMISSLKDLPVFHDWYRWMSRPITNFVESGDFDDDSFDILQKMNSVEIAGSTLIIGDGYYVKDGHYYMKNDSGYVRSILFWGIIGSAIAYIITIYTLLGVRKLSRLVSLVLIIVFIAFEYKGAVYYEFIPLAYIINVGVGLSNRKNGGELK